MRRQLSTLLALAVLIAVGRAQTAPQKPDTVPIPPTPQLELPGPPKTDSAAARPLTAEEAAQIALRLQPDVTVALAQAQAARAQVLEVRSALLPTVTIGTTYDWIAQLGAVNGAIVSPSGLATVGSVHQLLFDFDRTRDAVRQAQENAKAAGYSLSAVQANLVFQVKQQFYVVEQNLRLVGVQEANAKSDQDQLDLTVAELTSGLGAPADMVAASANLANATLDLVQARDTYLLSRVSLAALIGVDPRTPIVLAPSAEPEPDPLSLQELVDHALLQRPELLQAQATLRAAGYGVSVARKSLLPTLDLSLNAENRVPASPNDITTGTLGVALTWPLFDGGFTSGAVGAARAQALQAQAGFVSATQSVVSDVSQAYVNLQAARQRVDVAEAAVKNAQSGYNLSEGRYKAGVATFVEVTVAQATLVSAQSDQAVAEAQLKIARAQLARAVGAPLKAPPPGPIAPITPAAAAR